VRLFLLTSAKAVARRVAGGRDGQSEKVKQLEESGRQGRLGRVAIYPIANQQGCAMAPFAFAQAAGPAQLQESGLKPGVK